LEKTKDQDADDIKYFQSYFMNLSSEEPIIKREHLYYKVKADQYKYDINEIHSYMSAPTKEKIYKSKGDNNKVKMIRKQNTSKLLFGKGGVISEILNDYDCTEDFLTAYFIKTFITKKRSDVILLNGESFESGLRLDSNFRNIVHIGKGTNKLSGVTGSYDITDINVLKSLIIQIKASYSPCLIISDIYSTNHYTLYGILVLMLSGNTDTVSAIRIPDIRFLDAHVVNFIIVVLSYYTSVKIFKTPWHKNPKYYLICRNPRNKLRASTYTGILSYLSQKTNDNLIKKSSIKMHADLIGDVISKIIALSYHEEDVSTEDIWIEILEKNIDNHITIE
jgi:hypothetical protein